MDQPSFGFQYLLGTVVRGYMKFVNMKCIQRINMCLHGACLSWFIGICLPIILNSKEYCSNGWEAQTASADKHTIITGDPRFESGSYGNMVGLECIQHVFD